MTARSQTVILSFLAVTVLTTGDNSHLDQTTPDPEVDYVHTHINSPLSALSVTRVDIVQKTGGKRGVDIITDEWSHNIPYVLDPSFSSHGESTVYILKRAIKRIMDNVCVTYTDVTNTWNRTDSQWFTKNGYQSNAYVLIKDGAGCATFPGQGSGTGSRETSPCFDFVINEHEMLHTLGVVHMQKVPDRDRYLTLNYDDITPDKMGQYDKSSNKHFLEVAFDPISVISYSSMTWTRNGLPTFTPIREEIFHTDFYQPSDAVIFYELTQIFKCSEVFCNNSQVDCGIGYHTIVQGICKCVCPSGFDPDTNCARLINGASTAAKWPKTPMVILAGGRDNSCPSGFNQEVGWISFDGAYQDAVPVPMPMNKKTLYMPICTKNTPTNVSDIDWESWPIGGGFCMIKPIGVECGGDFKESTVFYKSNAVVSHNGSLGDIAVNGENTTVKMCCKNAEPLLLPIDLPNKDPFRLIAGYYCPFITGMRGYTGVLHLKTEVKDVSGPITLDYGIFDDELQFDQCYYLPPEYGCNQEIVLSSQTPSVTVTTPGFGSARSPNRRCLYSFTIPENSQVRITVNVYDLHEEDYLLVKRFNEWLNPYRIPSNEWPAPFLSEGDFLFLEYWSSWETSSNQGLNFTADLFLPEDSCYNVTTRGDDYFGNTSVTETYEDCLPWSETVECADFPTNGMNPVWLLLSGNKCRNPGGELIQPWCFTHKNGSNCHIRYCDVCNQLPSIDVIKNCARVISTDPEFCASAVDRFGCFKTCQFQQAPTTRSTCGPPEIPLDSILVESSKSRYFEGEKVALKCALANSHESQTEIMCTSSGWSHLTSACKACPENWLEYGDRCVSFSTVQTNVIKAEAACQGYGHNGTLFQIRDAKDQQMLRDYRIAKGSPYTGTTWISGEFRSDTGKWYFTNTWDEMTYTNWSALYVDQISDIDHNCVRLISESYDDKGGWHPVSCNSTNDRYNYVCQMDNSAGTCQDQISTSTCEQLMTTRPDFCTNSKFQSVSRVSCRKSCGFCEPSSTCKVNSSDAVVRTSVSDTALPGQVVTFACRPGHFLESGQLQRACAGSGKLLGADAVCVAHPVAQDVQLNAVIDRRTSLSQRKAVLFVDNIYRVPFDGKITRWYYYCKNPGLVSFLVYRPSPTSPDFAYVGFNNVTCQEGRVRSFYVATHDQISVQAGDVVGAYSGTSNTIAATSCSDYPDKVATVLEATATNFLQLPNVTFSKRSCFMASVGYRVAPDEIHHESTTE